MKEFLNIANIGHNLESWIIYHYFKNHKKYHDKKLRRENECGECNVLLYNQLIGKNIDKNNQTTSSWINDRKERGHFLSLIHSFDQTQLEYYYDGDMTSFSNYLSKLPIFKDEKVNQKLRELAKSIIE